MSRRSSPPPKSTKPFRLIVHIGAGKTGTSSIQASLLNARDKLNEDGVDYWGLMLELAPTKLYEWQKVHASKIFLDLQPDIAKQQLVTLLGKCISSARDSGIHTAIWSNEHFFKRHQNVIPALISLAQENIHIEIVAYVRRHDAWAKSAYVQWGLKHKTYRGPLRSFESWIKGNTPQFFYAIKPWLENFNKNILVRNMDAVGDSVADFSKIIGVNLEQAERLRTNESPSNEELALRALFNSNSKEIVRPSEFDRIFNAKELQFDTTIEHWLSSLMPNKADLEDVQEVSLDDREALNKVLRLQKQEPIAVSSLADIKQSIDTSKLIAVISQIVIQQSIKIDQLERKVNAPKTDNHVVANNSTKAVYMKDKNTVNKQHPIFAISTGRSGSTLVQRILNCHNDFVMWGEHYGFLSGLASVYAQMGNPNQKQYPKTSLENPGIEQLLPTLSSPSAAIEWANPWSFEEFKGQLKDFIETYFASRLSPGTRWGFKEIRYSNMPTLCMLAELFPDARFLFIKRDPLEVTRSKVFAFVKESKWSNFSDQEKYNRVNKMLNEVYEHYQVYDKFMQQKPNQGLVVNYEELVANPKEVTNSILSHCLLDPTNFDWVLADQVISSIITTTKRDDELFAMIKEVATEIKDAATSKI